MVDPEKLPTDVRDVSGKELALIALPTEAFRVSLRKAT
jgi:hypothetical protein